MDASSQIVSVKDNLLLAGLPETLRMQMESNLPVESYAAGEVLFRQGDPAKTIGLIIEGALMVSRGEGCLLYTSPSPRDATLSRMPSSA